MKNLLLSSLIVFQLVSCNSKEKDRDQPPVAKETTDQTVATEKASAATVFSGVLPCADCTGIETTLKIDQGDGSAGNQKFELTSVYKGKQPEKEFTEKGNFNTERGLENDPDGTIYILNWDKPESEQIYYGYKSSNPEKIYLLNNKKEIIKSKLDYFLTLKK